MLHPSDHTDSYIFVWLFMFPFFYLPYLSAFLFFGIRYHWFVKYCLVIFIGLIYFDMFDYIYMDIGVMVLVLLSIFTILFPIIIRYHRAHRLNKSNNYKVDLYRCTQVATLIIIGWLSYSLCYREFSLLLFPITGILFAFAIRYYQLHRKTYQGKKQKFFDVIYFILPFLSTCFWPVYLIIPTMIE